MRHEKNIKIIKISMVVFTAIFLAAIIFAVVSVFNKVNEPEANKFGDSVDIKNLKSHTKGKSTDDERVDRIKYDLLQTVNMNLDKPIDGDSLNDVIIRDETFEQTKDDATGIHTVKFIVDIASLEQSYLVSYQWVDEGSTAEPDEWGTAVSCLPRDKLIYKEFNCHDMFTFMSEGRDDSLVDKLPHTSNFYTIGHYVDNDKDMEPVISIQIMSNNNSSRTSARYEAHKTEALNWLKDNDINIDNYRIEFRNLSNDIVSTQPRANS